MGMGTVNVPGAAYTHPTGPGFNHIPAGGESGKILRWSANGEAAWGDDTSGEDLSRLTTNAKTNLVNAINYLDTFNQGGVPYGKELTESWSDLQARCTTGDFAGIHIGDFKTITLTTNEVVVMEVAGIDQYYKCANMAIGHHIDFISRDCLTGGKRMNAADTNNGTASQGSPWLASEMYQTLNNTSTGVFSTLPSDLKNCIIEKRALLEVRYSAGGAVSANTIWSWGLMGKLWLPTEIEVFGHNSWSEPGYGTAFSQYYPIFMNKWEPVIKGATWWMASASMKDTTNFCIVNSGGYSDRMNASNTSIRVPLCFRIGAAA